MFLGCDLKCSEIKQQSLQSDQCNRCIYTYKVLIKIYVVEVSNDLVLPAKTCSTGSTLL